MDKGVANNYFNHYKLENIQRLFFIALLVYPSMVFSDYSLIKQDFWFLLGSRFLFLTPYMLIYLFRKKINTENVDSYGVILFISAAIGATVPSYLYGGITSDYYFGIIVVSFVQFIVLPLNFRQTMIIEVIYMLIYFPVNIMPFDHNQILITKQLSNYLSFAIIKIAVSERFHTQILDSFKAMELNRKLEKKETVQMILGELCHLLNNPLFISTSLIKKLRKRGEYKDERDLIKAIEANDRMKEILKEMLKIQAKSSEEFEIEDNQTLKKFFEETDTTTKLPRPQ